MFVLSGPTELFITSKYDRHVQDWHWHQRMVIINPNYLADVAARQADKRARGIGPEGRCPA